MNAQTFFYPCIIQEQHLDTFGHVNNAIYLRLFEEARWEILTQHGYGLKHIQASGFGPTVLELKLIFMKELCLREQIVIESTMLSYERKVGKLSQKILRGSEICCEAEFTMGLFDLKARKLVLPTEDWLQAIGIKN